MQTSWSAAGYTEAEITRLREFARADVFLEASDLVDQHIVNHPSFLKHLEVFGKDREEAARDAIIGYQFGPVAENPAEFNSLLGVMNLKQHMWRSVALECLAAGQHLGFRPWELVVVRYGLQIAGVIDSIYTLWRAALIDSPLGERLKQMGADEAARWLENKDCANPYTIVKENASGGLEQIPYALAFPEEYAALGQLLTELLRELRPMQTDAPEAPAFVKYFNCYRQAIAETNLDRTEEAWAAVDTAWMKIRGDLQPVHAMESYMEPTRLRIDPEFRIVIADERAQQINLRARLSQERIITAMSEQFASYSTFQASRVPLMESLVHAGTTIVMSGCNANFRLAGQNVPNRVEVKLKHGTKIILDLKSTEIRTREMRQLMNHVFGHAFTAENYVDDGYLISAGVLVGGHEVCHNLFMTPETEARLGKALRSLVEETKADFGGVIVLLRQVDRGEIEWQELTRTLTCLLAAELRDLKSHEEESHRPYYIKCIAYFNMMLRSGLLKFMQGSWEVDFSHSVVLSFFAELTESFRRIAEAYEHYDRVAIERWLDEYFQVGSEIRALLALVT